MWNYFVRLTYASYTLKKQGFNIRRCILLKISQLEADATGDSMETQKLEVFGTPIGTLLSPKVEVNHNGNGDHHVSQAQLLKKEQLACPTLKKCFEEARKQKNNYWIEPDLLYHMGKVGGQKYVQLVVPECRSQEILKLEHETPVGGHLAARKTRDQIVMSFWWEKMPKDVKRLCSACHDY